VDHFGDNDQMKQALLSLSAIVVFLALGLAGAYLVAGPTLSDVNWSGTPPL
jgi:hypothetical protein